MALIKINTRSIPDDAVTPAKVSQNLGRRNLIINGAMQVAQRGTTFTTPASDGQLTDRWSVLANVNGASKVTYSQVTDSPNEFAYSIKADVATALTPLGASDYHIFRYNGFEQQDINQLAMGSSDAKEMTLSFWVKSNKTGTLAAELQMNSVEAGGASVELGKTYTINAANTWEKKTLTYSANTGHTSNQSGASRGMLLYMWVASGSNYQAGSIDTTWGVNNNRTTGMDNYLDSTSNEIYWTGFQLEAGDTATDFEHRSYGEELALCQRYFWQQTYDSTNAPVCSSAFWSTNSNIEWIVNYPQTMRAAPTISIPTIASLYALQAQVAWRQLSSYSLNEIGTKFGKLSGPAATNTSHVRGEGSVVGLRASGSINYDAEL